jgi:translation elongation factor EF-Tu-like GTPase
MKYLFLISLLLLSITAIIVSIENKKLQDIIKYDYYLQDSKRVKKLIEFVDNKQILETVLNICQIENVEPELVLSVIKVESNFKIYATGKNKNGTIDRGLMQINSSNIDCDTVYTPEKNIIEGVKILKWCLDKADNDVILALSYYNAGYGKVKQYKTGESTYKYISKIIKEYEELKK